MIVRFLFISARQYGVADLKRSAKPMPIIIYPEATPKKQIAWLCDDEWTLPTQVAALESWLKRKKKMKAGAYIADIGFQARKDAGGGGSALSPEMMKKMADFGITLFLSEYPGFAKKKKRPNKAVEPTAMTRPPSATIPAPLAHF